MADKLDLLLSRMNDLEPKLDILMVALKQFVQDEVASQVAAQLGQTEAADDGSG